MKNWKNHPKKKLAQTPFSHSPAQATAHSPQPKIDFPYHEISQSYVIKSAP